VNIDPDFERKMEEIAREKEKERLNAEWDRKEPKRVEDIPGWNDVMAKFEPKAWEKWAGIQRPE
jgi:hypothetical protein